MTVKLFFSSINCSKTRDRIRVRERIKVRVNIADSICIFSQSDVNISRSATVSEPFKKTNSLNA